MKVQCRTCKYTETLPLGALALAGSGAGAAFAARALGFLSPVASVVAGVVAAGAVYVFREDLLIPHLNETKECSDCGAYDWCCP